MVIVCRGHASRTDWLWQAGQRGSKSGVFITSGAVTDVANAAAAPKHLACPFQRVLGRRVGRAARAAGYPTGPTSLRQQQAGDAERVEEAHWVVVTLPCVLHGVAQQKKTAVFSSLDQKVLEAGVKGGLCEVAHVSRRRRRRGARR